MAWASIGSNDFIDMQGVIRTMTERLDELVRPGVSGQGYRRTGTYGRPFTLVTITGMTTASAIDDRMNTYKQLVGDSVTIQDALGNSYQDMIILDVELLASTKVGVATPGPTGTPVALMSCLWTLQQDDV